MQWTTKDGFSFLVEPVLSDLGIVHGFTGSDLDFSNQHFEAHAERLCKAFQADFLFCPKQVHGEGVVDLGQTTLLREIHSHECSSLEADALFVSRLKQVLGSKIIVGVRSADCLPILMVSEESIALVHAGWRGLASNLLKNVLTLFKKQAQKRLICVFGPCAGAHNYEVGSEVVDSIGSSASFSPSVELKKSYLDLASTAENQIREYWKFELSCIHGGLCTMSNLKFHSYRRDSERSGRNLTFVML